MAAIWLATVIALAGNLPASETTVVSGYFERFAQSDDRTACDFFLDRLLTTNVSSLNRCAAVCLSKSECASLFFQRSSGKCNLCTDHHVRNNGQYPAAGTRYFYRIAGSCDSSTGYRYFPQLNSCIKLHLSLTLGWMDALNHCKTEGASLVTLDTQELLDFFGVFLNTNGLTGFYHVGAADEGQGWLWRDGRPVNSSLWKAGEESVTNKYCSAMVKFSKLERKDCYLDTYNFACQKSP